MIEGVGEGGGDDINMSLHWLLFESFGLSANIKLSDKFNISDDMM